MFDKSTITHSLTRASNFIEAIDLETGGATVVAALRSVAGHFQTLAQEVEDEIVVLPPPTVAAITAYSWNHDNTAAVSGTTFGEIPAPIAATLERAVITPKPEGLTTVNPSGPAQFKVKSGERIHIPSTWSGNQMIVVEDGGYLYMEGNLDATGWHYGVYGIKGSTVDIVGGHFQGAGSANIYISAGSICKVLSEKTGGDSIKLWSPESIRIDGLYARLTGFEKWNTSNMGTEVIHPDGIQLVSLSDPLHVSNSVIDVRQSADAIALWGPQAEGSAGIMAKAGQGYLADIHLNNIVFLGGAFSVYYRAVDGNAHTVGTVHLTDIRYGDVVHGFLSSDGDTIGIATPL